MFRFYYPAIIWGLIIFVLCAIPGKNLPHYTWADLLSFDKIVHFTMFFILIVLLKRAWVLRHIYQKNIPSNLTAIIIGIAYGGGLELMQTYFYIDRTGSWFDFLANSVGAITGAALFPKIFDQNGHFILLGKR
jgi:VanZ family protein